MYGPFNSKLSLAAAALLCLAIGPVGASATEKVIIKDHDKHKEVIVKEKKEVVVVRPVKTWEKKPHYGQFLAGVTLGTIIAANAAGVAPTAPGPNVCWYWADPTMRKGYWDHC